METVIDLVSGTVGGCTGIVVGQPLDTVKVRVQSLPGVYAGPVDCFLRTLRHEGVLALFKGVVSPVVGNAPMNGVVFGGYGAGMRALDSMLGPLPDDAPVSLVRIGSAATFAGLLQTVVASPVEMVKCRLQVQNTSTGPAAYTGAVDCLRQQVRAHGVWRGVFQGFVPTSIRDAPGFGVYFMTYEALKEALTPAGGPPSWASMLVAGGFAGQLTWASTFPFDVVKSRVQTLPTDAPALHRTLAYQFRTVYAESGVRGFFSGLGATVVRAFPVNAVTFLVYEMVAEAMRDRWDGGEE